jgi:signal transduction histidine kinase
VSVVLRAAGDTGAGGDTGDTADLVELVVEDDGPGFPDGAAAVGRGTSYGGSTGLGLDIVRRTAEASGGRVELGTGPAGGARVTVVLGRARRVD